MKTAFSCMLVVLVSISVVRTQSSKLALIKDESSVTYRLVHPLHKIESTSKDVQYLLEADVTTRQVQRVSAEVDVTTFDSGNSNRDSHAMEVIDAISYPEANFNSTSITQTADSIHVDGKLTFHGVTRDVSIAGALNWSNHKLVMQGGFDVSLEAFNIERPSLLMIPVADALSFSIVAAFEWK